MKRNDVCIYYSNGVTIYINGANAGLKNSTHNQCGYNNSNLSITIGIEKSNNKGCDLVNVSFRPLLNSYQS